MNGSQHDPPHGAQSPSVAPRAKPPIRIAPQFQGGATVLVRAPKPSTPKWLWVALGAALTAGVSLVAVLLWVWLTPE